MTRRHRVQSGQEYSTVSPLSINPIIHTCYYPSYVSRRSPPPVHPSPPPAGHITQATQRRERQTVHIMPPKSAKTAVRSTSAAIPVVPEPTTTADQLAATNPSSVDDAADSTPSTVDSLTGRKLVYPLPKHISSTTINNTQSFLRIVILGLICAAAIGVRLFAVIRFESVIHEL